MLRVLLTIGLLQALTMVVLFVRTKSLALLLGPESIGVMAVIDKLVAVVAQTASLSLPYAALRFLPVAWERNPVEYAVLLRSMLRVLVWLMVAACVAGVAVTVLHPTAWGNELGRFRPVVLMAFATVPTLVFVTFLQNAIAGRLMHYESILWALAHAVVFTATSVAGAWWFGLEGLYALYAGAGTVLVCATAVWLLRSARSRISASAATLAPIGPGGLPAEIWRFCLAMLALAFLSPYAALFVHYSVLTQLGAEAAGWMQAAVGISLLVRMALGSAHPVFLTPNVSRGGSFNERLTWANAYQKTLCCLIVVAVPPLLLFPTIPVAVLYSPAFQPGARVVALFVIGEIIILLAGTYGGLLIAFNHIRFHVVQNLVAQGLMMAAAAILIPRLGIGGAAWAALAMPVALFAGTTGFLRVSHDTWAPRPVAGVLVFVGVVLSTSGALGVAYQELTWGSAVVKGVCYITALAGLFPFLTRDDRRTVARFAANRFRRAPAAD